MRVGPLLAAIVIFVIVVSSLGQTLLWAVAGISVLALIILIVFAARANRFHGPKILYDDAKEGFDKFGRNSEEEVVLISKTEDSSNEKI